MDAIDQNTTSAYATRLRIRVPVVAGTPTWSGNGNPLAVGTSMPSHGTAGASEQGVGIRVFANGRGRIDVPAPGVENREPRRLRGFCCLAPQ